MAGVPILRVVTRTGIDRRRQQQARVRQNLHLAGFGRVFGGVSILTLRFQRNFPFRPIAATDIAVRTSDYVAASISVSKSSPLLHYELAVLTNPVRLDCGCRFHIDLDHIPLPIRNFAIQEHNKKPATLVDLGREVSRCGRLLRSTQKFISSSDYPRSRVTRSRPCFDYFGAMPKIMARGSLFAVRRH
jgi:hypothetical protein